MTVDEGTFHPKETTVVFRVPRQLLADLLEAEKAMLADKRNRTKQEFIHLARALLTSMEDAAAKDATR